LGEKNLTIYQRVLGPDHFETRLLKLYLCSGYASLGEFATVVALMQPLVDSTAKSKSPPNDFTMMTQLNLANAQRDLGHYEIAEALYHEVKAAAPVASGDARAVALVGERFACQLTVLRGKFPEGVGERQEGQFAPADPRTSACRMDLAGLLLRRGATTEAEAILRPLVDARERDAGLDALPTLATLDALGVDLGLEGRWAEAETTLRLSGEHWRTVEPGGWREAMNRIALGWVLYAKGHRADAVPLLDAGYTMVENPAKLSPGERVIRSVLVARIAEVYGEDGNFAASNRWHALGSR